jgi:L-2-hydroxyglutarate oxidase
LRNGLQDLKYLSREEFREIEPLLKDKGIKVPKQELLIILESLKRLKNFLKNLVGEVRFNNEVKKYY